MGVAHRFPRPSPAPPRTDDPSKGVSPLPWPITHPPSMITRRVQCAVTAGRAPGRSAARTVLWARDAALSRPRPAPSGSGPRRPGSGLTGPGPGPPRPGPGPRGPGPGWLRPPRPGRLPGSQRLRPSRGIPPGPAPPSRGAGRTAHTVVPRSSARTPQLEHRCSTMPRPRPPMEDSDGRAARGRVALPPSLTMTSTAVAESIQETRMQASGSGRACRIALLSSSLVTRAASATAAAGRPASRNSAPIRPRATATLDGTQGSRTTLAALTSPRAPAPWPR